MRATPTLTLLLAAVWLAAGCAKHSASPIRINEVVPSNDMGCADPSGERNDWIELYNTSTAAVDLGGYSLTDDTATPRKSVLPRGLVIGAGGVLLLWADGTTDQGTTHLSFKLTAKGEEVVLYDADEQEVDRVVWTDGVSDVSHARVPDGLGEFALCARPTCGALNGSSCSP